MSLKDDSASAGDLKYVAHVLDLVNGEEPCNGFLAPGARVSEQPALEAEIKRLVEAGAALKCPRCRNYHTIHGNPYDCCDRCVYIVSSMVPDLLASGAWTQESADEWRALVKESVNRWKAKT